MFFKKCGNCDSRYPVYFVKPAFGWTLFGVGVLFLVGFWFLVSVAWWSILVTVIVGILALMSLQFPHVGSAYFGRIFLPIGWRKSMSAWRLNSILAHESQHLDDQSTMGMWRFLFEWLTPKGMAYLEARAYYYDIMARAQNEHLDPKAVATYYSTKIYSMPYFQGVFAKAMDRDLSSSFYLGLASKGLEITDYGT